MEYEIEYINEIKENADVDVFLITYQHSKYVEQAIESVLMQKTKYNIRIIAMDDCSTDGTQDILRKYQKKYSDKVMLVLNKNNSKAKYIKQAQMSFKQSRYACFLEGDDYWVDYEKIDKQIKFLENHSEYIGTTGNVMNVNEDGSKQHRDFHLYSFKESHVYGRENVKRMEMLSHISALMFRNIMNTWDEAEYNDYYSCRMNGDQKLASILGMMGQVYYSHEVYSHHRRVFSGDSWTAQMQNNKSEILIEMWEDLQKYILQKFGEKIRIEEWVKSEREKLNNANNMTSIDALTKQKNINRTINMWLLTKGGEGSLEDVLTEMGIKNIAIYGMSDLGIRLYYELDNTKVSISYGMDRNPEVIIPNFKIYKTPPLDEEKVDAVIVTALTTFDDIKKELLKVGYKNVLSLDELLYTIIPPDDYLKKR